MVITALFWWSSQIDVTFVLVTKNLIYLIAIAALLILSTGCDPSEEEVRAIIMAEVHKKTEAYKAEEMEKCHQEALRLAEIIVDSIIFSRQMNPLQDSLYRPVIPPRPTFVPVDSTVFDSKHSVKPIL